VSRTQLASGTRRDGDGGAVEIRTASGADCEAIKSFIMGLSLRARFLRFFSPVAPPSSAVLRRMCGVGPDSDVLVATESGAVVGHAMAVDVTEPDGRRVADIGLVVTDRWQNHGIGSQMFGQVIERAADRGVSGLVMEVLPENRRMLEMITSRWGDAGYEFGGGSVTIRVSLPGASAATGGREAQDGRPGQRGREGKGGREGKDPRHGAAVRAA
jgi:GNAT superfamily N-acetyltransferase